MTTSVRLTKYSRENLVNMLMNHKYNEDKESACIIQAVKNFANKIYEDTYGDNIEKINALPKGWLPEIHHLYVNFGVHGSRYIFFNGNPSAISKNYSMNKYWASLKEEQICKRVPANEKRNIVYDADSKFTQELVDLDKRIGEFEKGYLETKLTAEKIIGSVNTSTQLIEAWPEIEPFVRDLFKISPKINLPAINMTEVNKLFELPVE